MCVDRCLENEIMKGLRQWIGPETKIRLLSLEALIRIKQETARDKDRAMLAILRRTFEEKSKGEC